MDIELRLLYKYILKYHLEPTYSYYNSRSAFIELGPPTAPEDIKTASNKVSPYITTRPISIRLRGKDWN